MLSLSTLNVVGQQDTNTSHLPDTPSATKTKKPQSDVVNLLAGKSRVLPNLAVNTRPMTDKEKFLLAIYNALSPVTVIGSAAGAGISQARNTRKGYGQGAEGYFKRWGAAMAFASSNQLIGTYAVASMLHEDPRYFVEDSGKLRESVRYAVSRVFICRKDDGGVTTNWAGIVGPLGAAGLANVYLPPDSQGVGDTFRNWGYFVSVRGRNEHISRVLATHQQEAEAEELRCRFRAGNGRAEENTPGDEFPEPSAAVIAGSALQRNLNVK